MKVKQYYCCICNKEYQKQNSIQKTCRPTCQKKYEKQRREEKSKKLSIRISGVDNESNRLEIRKHVEDFMPSLLGTKKVTIKVSRCKVKTDLEKQIDKADTIFGEYIRTRDSLKTTNTLSLCECITCHTIVNNIQCGHFITRGNKSVRWNEMNANGQCPKCNNWGSGEQSKHSLEIDIKFGKGTSDKIIGIGNTPIKVSDNLLEEIIINYKNKIDLLKKSI